MTTRPIQETYTISDPDAQRIYTSVRRASAWTSFLLSHLRPGMALLYCAALGWVD